jgi:hypothetical protein
MGGRVGIVSMWGRSSSPTRRGELEVLLERRRRWGADHNDDIRAGVLHIGLSGFL